MGVKASPNFLENCMKKISVELALALRAIQSSGQLEGFRIDNKIGPNDEEPCLGLIVDRYQDLFRILTLLDSPALVKELCEFFAGSYRFYHGPITMCVINTDIGWPEEVSLD